MKSWPIVLPWALATIAAVAFDVGGPLQIVGVGLFLLVCPAFGYVRMLDLADTELEIALTVGLGLSVDALVSLVLVAAGVYDPLLAVSIIAAIAVAGSLVEARRPKPVSSTSRRRMISAVGS